MAQQAPRRIVLTLAAFAAVAYLACVVCAFGFTSLATDGNVIDQPDAGPLVGPIMVGAATIVLFIGLLVVGIRLDAGSRVVPLWTVLVVALVTTAAYLLSGSLAYSATTGDGLDVLLFFGHQLGTWFTLAVLLLAALVAMLYLLVLLRQLHGGKRPLWPWERREQ